MIEKKEVYLDNSATTRPCPEAVSAINMIMGECWGNPSSMHKKGVEAENAMHDAAKKIAGILHCAPDNIIFTSGGTESDNMAVLGCAFANVRRGRHIITTTIEHPAVSSPMAYLEERGFDVTYLKPDGRGIVDAAGVMDALRDDTILVSVMAVNNELGTKEPIEKIGGALRQERPDVIFHTDAVQAFGKYELRPEYMGIGLMSASGHKIHGPKGVGFLYIGDNVKIRPIIFGGGQGGRLRSGTENVPGICGMAEAAGMLYSQLEDNNERLYGLKRQLENGLLAIGGVTINSPGENDGAPHILNASFGSIKSEVLLHALEEEGIYVSAGSACSSHKKGENTILRAAGLSRERAESAIRFSMSIYTTKEDIDYTIRVLNGLVPVLGRMKRR